METNMKESSSCPRRRLTPAERFASWVDDSAGPGGCHLWGGATSTDGYGVFHVGPGQWASAHRFAFEMATGRPVGQQHLRHLCNDKLCVNQNHLVPGTIRENALDRVRAGVSNKRALTDERVVSLRRLYAAGARIADLTRAAGISRVAVRRMLRGVTYREEGKAVPA
jgi:hypothetical protein